jgi:7-carboxy-7-deazaguanine synthase
MELARININEVFGPTIQGEGPFIGKPCFFIRTHNCPVRCAGCDSHFTWDGSEKGTPILLNNLHDTLEAMSRAHPHCGLVLSGGEPLLHFRNRDFIHMLCDVKIQNRANGGSMWLSLETSGFIGPKVVDDKDLSILYFLKSFDSVSISPKTTPCLHGEGWTDDELLVNVDLIALLAGEGYAHPFFKFVARDEKDIEAIKQTIKVLKSLPDPPLDRESTLIYIMPYGQEPEEILETCRFLVPVCAENGWVLTPRLHSLLWGARRGV